MRTVGLIIDASEISRGVNDFIQHHADKSAPEPDIDFGKMKVDELRAFALQSGIELPQGAKRSEIISAIKENNAETFGGDA